MATLKQPLFIVIDESSEAFMLAFVIKGGAGVGGVAGIGSGRVSIIASLGQSIQLHIPRQNLSKGQAILYEALELVGWQTILHEALELVGCHETIGNYA